MSEPGPKLPHRIGLLAVVVTRHPLVTIVAVLAVTVGAFSYTAQAWRAGNFGINTDTADMISAALPWRQDFIAYRDSFPARDRNIVVVVDAATGDAAADFATRLATTLEAEPDLFPSVFFGRSEDFFVRNGLLYLSLDELDRLDERLARAQPFLGRLAGEVSGGRILEVLTEALDPDLAVADSLQEDLDAIYGGLAASLAAANAGSAQPLAWRGLIGLGDEPEGRQLVLIRPTLDFSRVRPARDAIERIRAVGGELLAAADADLTMRLTGTLAMEHEELSSVTESASVAGIAALIMVTIVLLWALRSVALLLVALVTLLSGLVLTATFAALTVGHLNLLSVAFAVLYIGLGVDFILHLTLRFRELWREGLDVAPALVETARGVGTSLVICAFTTAVGFFAFIPTDFVGISELGVIAGGGMIISLLVSLTLLPALLRLVPGRSPRPGSAAAASRFRFRTLPATLVCILAAVVSVAALLLLPGLRFDGNPIHLRDPDAESIRTLEDLADANDAPLFSLVAVVDSEAAAADAAARLQQLGPVISDVATIASFVPGDQDEKLYVIEDMSIRLGASLRALEVSSAEARIGGPLERLTAALRQLGEPSAAQREFLAAAEVWLDRWRNLQADAGDAAAFELALDQAIAGDLLAQLELLERGLEAQAFGRDDLPPSLSDRWVNAAGQELVEVIPSENLNDNEAASRFVSAVREVVPNATGLPVVYEEAAATVTRAFSIALVYAFAAVTILLLAFMRSIRDALLVLVPITFAAVVTAATSVVFGLPLNFANIIALPLLIGVGVDSGIHMVHRMRSEPPGDGDPLHTSTSRAVLASALTTVASFGNLAFSTHVGMASMGQLLTLGMIMSVIAILVLLPALMRLGRSAR